jgi:hypothetical protein
MAWRLLLRSFLIGCPRVANVVRHFSRQDEEVGLVCNPLETPIAPVVCGLPDPILRAREEVPVDVTRLGERFSSRGMAMINFLLATRTVGADIEAPQPPPPAKKGGQIERLPD